MAIVCETVYHTNKADLIHSIYLYEEYISVEEVFVWLKKANTDYDHNRIVKV